jgi:beta-lactamase regulating signal transducer with metallopeptidase domain
MAFKEYATMLLRAQIIIHADHKNLTYTSSVNKRVLHQLNYVKLFDPEYQHISGEDPTFLLICLVALIASRIKLARS